MAKTRDQPGLGLPTNEEGPYSERPQHTPPAAAPPPAPAPVSPHGNMPSVAARQQMTEPGLAVGTVTNTPAKKRKPIDSPAQLAARIERQIDDLEKRRPGAAKVILSFLKVKYES